MQDKAQHTNNELLLWQAIQQGDQAAFATLYDAHIHALYRYAQRITQDEVLIADAIQDIFLELWRSRQRLACPQAFRHYLLGMLRNRLILLHKKNNFISTDSDITADLSISPENEYIHLEQQQTQQKHLGSYLKMLPSNHQQVLALRFYEEMSYAEIADLMGIKEQSVRNIVQRAISKLRSLMESEQGSKLLSNYSFWLLLYFATWTQQYFTIF